MGRLEKLRASLRRMCLTGAWWLGGVLVVARETFADRFSSFRNKLRQGFAIFFLSAAGGYAVLMTGDQTYNLQSLVLGFYRLSLLQLWALVAGWMLDLANKVSFDNDKKLIDGGNLAVALSRSIGYAALVVGGAMLIAKV
jgi:hypothetical protein